MLQPRGDLDLAFESLGAKRGANLGVENLERDGAVVAQVLGEEDDGKSPAAQLAFDAIAVSQCGGERVAVDHPGGTPDERIGNGTSRMRRGPAFPWRRSHG